MLSYPLALVYNQLFVSAVPDDWKIAVVVPVLNKGFAGSVSNYTVLSPSLLLLAKYWNVLLLEKLLIFFTAKQHSRPI